jgi:membrane protein YdbS with pleckstrin-like domain
MADLYKSKTPSDPTEVNEHEVYEERMHTSREWWKAVVDEVLEKVGEKPGSHAWGAYIVRPGCKFMTQQEDEEIVLLLRAHPITNVGWVLLTLLMLVLPGFLQAAGVFAGVAFQYLFVGKLVWYLVTLMYAFERFLYWYYSVFIVTNERLVDIDFDNLIWRDVTNANLNHIEEPEMVTGGFVRSMFQYGDVFVTTASERPSLEALAVPRPQNVVDIISRLSEELEKRREQGR